MTDPAAQADEFQDFGPVDGVHELRQRKTTSLWYRAIQSETIQLAPVVRAPHALPQMEQPDLPPSVPMADQLAEIARIAIAAGQRAEAHANDAKPPVEPAEAPFWRTVPATCPALMLSESSTLGGQVSDAHLAPGVQFRVASIANGVAEVEVLSEAGDIVRGYCNTVDLACANPDGAPARPGSGKLRLPKTSRFRMPSLSPSFGASR